MIDTVINASSPPSSVVNESSIRSRITSTSVHATSEIGPQYTCVSDTNSGITSKVTVFGPTATSTLKRIELQ